MKAVLLIVSLFLFSTGTAAAAEDILALSERLQTLYNALSTFQAEFSSENTHQESGDSQALSGILSFKKPGFLRWEVREPSPELLILGADAAWQYIEEDEIAYKYQPDMAADSGLLFRVLTGQSRLDEEFDISALGEEDGRIHLRALPKEPVPQMVEAEIWLDAESGYIRRVKSVDFYGNGMDVTLEKLAVNPALDDALFSFTPPEGVLVEDNTIQAP